LVYLVAFYAVWSCYILLITPHFGRGPLFLIVENLVKLAVWTLPVLVWIRYVDRQDPLAYLKLRENIHPGVLYGLLAGGLLATYLVGQRLVVGFHGFDLGFAWSQWIGGVVLVGVTEEVVFRGFVLQRLLTVTRFRWANLVTSFLFLLIHFPRWIRDDQLASAEIIGAILYVFAFSYLQGYLLKRSGSLWSCFLSHAIGNLTSFALGSAAAAGIVLLLS
jgi:membrane protease YdiL (CAAX protease family)